MSDDPVYDLLQVRDRFRTSGGASLLDDLEFLLELAEHRAYDLTASELAAGVRHLLVADAYELWPPRPSAEPIGPLVRVDAYECEVDRVRVEVERTPGTDDVQSGQVGAYLEDELLSVVPQCSVCEAEMTSVGRKLRRFRPAPAAPP